MLVLTRKIGESIIIGDDVVIMLIDVYGSQAKIGINAPKSVIINRKEIHERIQAERLEDSKGKKGAVISGDIWEKDGNK